MTKEQIKNMMEATGQELVYEDGTYLDYENPMYGEVICFEFNEEGLLKRVFS